jgi:hypothetical protein
VSREGLEVADVFRHFGPAFRDQHGASLSAARRRAMTRLGQLDRILPLRMAEMLEVDKAGPKVRC